MEGRSKPYNLRMQDIGVSRRTFARAIAAGAALASLPRLVEAAAKTPAGAVRLSANENPYGPSASAMQAMTDALHEAPRYPDDLAEALAADLARFHAVSPDEILLGDGSSDNLRLVAAAYASGPNKKLVVADPTFEAIVHYAANSGANVVKVPLDAGFAHDLDKMRDADVVYICNPNNPTATITPKERIRAFLAAVPATTIVLVDEAYHHYVNSGAYESVIPLVKTQPNLIVARTFSKIYAMAGVRCGYCVAQKSVIDKLGATQQWDAMNVVALAGARASIADSQHVIAGRRHNDETKQWLAAQMKGLGYEMLPSEANFVMIDVRRDVKPLIGAIREHGVHVGRLFPAMPHHLRVTIGRPEEMAKFVAAFKETVAV
jgi:histidinol-phosphate aminotransferase